MIFIKRIYNKYKRRFDFIRLSPRFRFLMKECGLSPRQLEKKEHLKKVSRETLKKNRKLIKNIASQIEDINN